MEPRISVVVCTYNRAEMLRRALESLCALNTNHEFSYEIVVVDDASTDDTPSVIQEEMQRSRARIQSIRESGKGVAAARNAGIEIASGEWIAFFDDDQLAEPSWLLELWKAQAFTGALCVGGSRVLELPPEELHALSPIIRRILGEIPIEREARACRRHDSLCTGNALVHRTVFERVGGFDAGLTQGGEDTDFFLRVHKAGIACWYTPSAIVVHMVPAYRLEEAYLTWAATRGGECFANRDAADWGRARTVALAVVRLAHAGLVHAPLRIASRVSGDHLEWVGRKCQMRRASAYARRALRLLGSRKGAGVPPHTGIEFRSERNLFLGS